MNSHQRRTDRRKWKHTVRIPYSTRDENYNEMWDWAAGMFGNSMKRNVWREAHYHIGTCWQFNDSKAASLFALRWGADA